MKTVVGVFPSRAEAENVARDLNAVGIPSDDVSIADGAHAEGHEWSQRNLAAAGGLSAGWFIAGLIPMVAKRSFSGAIRLGALIGGFAGVVGWLIAMAIRGGIPMVAGSPVATACGAVLIGAAFGGLIAGMYNMGVSHEDIPLGREAVREHGVVVAAHVDQPREPEALRVMTEHGARNLRDDADAWKASGWTGPHMKDEPYPSDSSIRKHEPGN
jgi:hypothetical protein